MLIWFIGSLLLIFIAYVGYPIFCFVRARLFAQPILRGKDQPKVSVLIAAYREAGTIARKLESLSRQTYPQTLIEIIVACDGSDDGTDEVAARTAGVCVVKIPSRRGKPNALNEAARAASGQILILTDARQPLSENAIEVLVADLGDPKVGAVGGELVMGGDAPAGAYWKYEALIRKMEGRAGSTVGVSGALYAIRRELFVPLPEETILDDVLAPMRVRLGGLRVGFEPEAKAFDVAAQSAREFQRKVRTLSGNFQLLAIEPRLLSPFHNPSWLDFVCHKLLRLVVPYALLIALLSPLAFAPILTGLQLVGYGLAALRGIGQLKGVKLAGLAETFVVLNAAAVVGLFRFLRYGRKLPW